MTDNVSVLFLITILHYLIAHDILLLRRLWNATHRHRTCNKLVPDFVLQFRCLKYMYMQNSMTVLLMFRLFETSVF